jgi:hypothetical protein
MDALLLSTSQQKYASRLQIIIAVMTLNISWEIYPGTPPMLRSPHHLPMLITAATSSSQLLALSTLK